MKKNCLISLFYLMVCTFGITQEVPVSYSNIKYNDNNQLVFVTAEGEEWPLVHKTPKYQLQNFLRLPQGTDEGMLLDFNMPDFNGKLYYGFINYNDAKFALPVYFKKTNTIENGKVEIKITDLANKYDMIGWEESGAGIIGYRVVNEEGEFIFDGKFNFTGKGPFSLAPTIVLGPFVNRVTPKSATISFRTLQAIQCSIQCNNQVFSDEKAVEMHEILIDNLNPNTTYDYTIHYGDQKLTFQVKTSPEKGTKSAFTFSYASDSRAGKGGGERDVYGANFYAMKRIMAANNLYNVAFMQFTGDLINGYKLNDQQQALEYFNWFKSIEPFAPYFPTYIGMGNHEALMYQFNDGQQYGITIDQFPFETHSAEKLFSDFVTNPISTLKSEDGAIYDPNPNTTDFPSYSENVFSYTYDNVAVIVLNSDYWYAPSLAGNSASSGGLHGYIMDNQLNWLKSEVAKFENDKQIDHVFITEHTPFFPNGGHVSDDMWYRGNNDFRPWVAGKPLAKGIIERRDEMLDVLVNKSSKVRAILTGDEHNYVKTEIGPETVIYPENYTLPKLKLNRTIWQINNGSAGAPYYAQEQTPWTPKATNFSTQTVLVLFDVEGKKINMRVINPDTFEKVDGLKLVE